MNKITAVTGNDDFSFDLQFDDDSLKRFDAKPYLDYEVFRELKDLDYFKQVDIAFGRCNGHMSKTSVQKLYTSRVYQFQGTGTTCKSKFNEFLTSPVGTKCL